MEENIFGLKMKIWIDLENAPHVWVFKEFINKFKENNIGLIVTVRDFSYTIPLCDYLDIKYFNISVNKSKSSIGKFYSTVYRAMKLRSFIKKNANEIAFCLSHGSRSAILAAKFLNLKTISLDDYEFSFKLFNHYLDYLLTPEPISYKDWGLKKCKVINYPGLKEELYLWNERNYCGGCNTINLPRDKINIIFRPESPSAHYQSDKSHQLHYKILDKFSSMSDINIILLARSKEQEKNISKFFNERNINYQIPATILNGPSIVYNCDSVVGGGGTMTREAALLGVQSFSFFGGEIGKVDKYLIDKGRLHLLQNFCDIENMKIEKRNVKDTMVSDLGFNYVLKFLLEQL